MKRNIFVNGTFDVLHVGHIQLLQYASTLGSVTVGIDADIRVKQLKGKERPINNQNERKIMLEALRYVDNVVIFYSDKELVDLVAACDIMVKGSDYQNKNIIGETVCKELRFFDRIDGYSTTQKIQDIITRR